MSAANQQCELSQGARKMATRCQQLKNVWDAIKTLKEKLREDGGARFRGFEYKLKLQEGASQQFTPKFPFPSKSQEHVNTWIEKCIGKA